jgi:hypothetical protein
LLWDTKTDGNPAEIESGTGGPKEAAPLPKSSAMAKGCQRMSKVPKWNGEHDTATLILSVLNLK